ncbi:Dihydrodipicolinate synthetase family protein [Rhodospirillaceae bacterium LM-1]|nr:Dihydrodipicolinate synthetase family protein [Rhodospirillaceae bacterium LM-1]
MTGLAKGVWAAALTPLDANLTPDIQALVSHCRWLLANGCDGLAVLGTTGEANSFSVSERLAILDGLAEAGIPGANLVPGTGCCAFPDTVALTKRAIEMGALGVLVLPPFYYKNVAEDGVFASYARVIEEVGDSRLRLYLYHFPKLSGVPITHSLIERLMKAYPGTIAGLKDSAGELVHTLSLIKAFPELAIMAGYDDGLLPVLAAGGAGCITACANIASPLAAAVVKAASDPKRADQAQAKLTSVRRIMEGMPMIAAMKELLALHTGKEGWRRVRPPQVNLSKDKADALSRQLADIGFSLAPVD